MGTLYVRIIMTTMAIMIASSLFAFIATNVYYHHFLKSDNDEKITHIAEKTAIILEGVALEEVPEYLIMISDLGYQFYLVDEQGNTKTYGDSFRKHNLQMDDIELVLSGEVYHGIANFPRHLFITGFFNNGLKNTIGVPVSLNENINALFVRPNTVKQFGEMRYFLAVLLVLALLFTFLFVLTSTTFLVNPIKRLTRATNEIAAGNYHLKLKMNRRDEIGKLAHDFTKMSDSLEKTEERRQEFVSNVSHEIQSPLTSIQGFSQALREEELPEEKRIYYLEIIEKESRRLSALSKQLLTLSSLDNELDIEGHVVLDLGKQLKEAVSTTEWQWREKDLTINMHVSSKKVMGDPGLLQQIWMNLITNAIHYTNPGGSISIYMEEIRDNIKVSVSDTGIGINQAHVPQLFDRFYKVDKARTRTEESTGLGLSIARKVVVLHEGTIMVESEQGKGSTFNVFLPKIK